MGKVHAVFKGTQVDRLWHHVTQQAAVEEVRVIGERLRDEIRHGDGPTNRLPIWPERKPVVILDPQAFAWAAAELLAFEGGFDRTGFPGPVPVGFERWGEGAGSVIYRRFGPAGVEIALEWDSVTTRTPAPVRRASATIDRS
jgi:hypothetical protein